MAAERTDPEAIFSAALDRRTGAERAAYLDIVTV